MQFFFEETVVSFSNWFRIAVVFSPVELSVQTAPSSSKGLRWEAGQAVQCSRSWLGLNYRLGRSEEPWPRKEVRAPKEETSSAVILCSRLRVEQCSGHSRSWGPGPAGWPAACGGAAGRRDLLSLGILSLTSH